ncbi:MAG: DUF192 domain-containing protein [Ignavibacteriaceae bacterium]|jgi:hypothetical protein|nr:DUF192 domain-containing protein [Ignavibacteriaceae bacterium]
MKKPNVNKGKTANRKKIFYAVGAIVIIAVYLFAYIIPNLTNKQTEETEYNFMKEGTLTFTDSLNNPITKIDLEIADSDYDRQLGLMFRKSMEMNQGMLFIFPEQEPLSFWMRNTYISLDMIFVNADKKIVTIHKNTKTLSDQSYPSTEPAQYVVEVVAGFADKYSLKVGDKINW